MLNAALSKPLPNGIRGQARDGFDGNGEVHYRVSQQIAREAAIRKESRGPQRFLQPPTTHYSASSSRSRAARSSESSSRAIEARRRIATTSTRRTIWASVDASI